LGLEPRANKKKRTFSRGKKKGILPKHMKINREKGLLDTIAVQASKQEKEIGSYF